MVRFNVLTYDGDGWTLRASDVPQWAVRRHVRRYTPYYDTVSILVERSR